MKTQSLYLDAIALFLLASVCGGEFDGVGGVLLAPLFWLSNRHICRTILGHSLRLNAAFRGISWTEIHRVSLPRNFTRTLTRFSPLSSIKPSCLSVFLPWSHIFFFSSVYHMRRRWLNANYHIGNTWGLNRHVKVSYSFFCVFFILVTKLFKKGKKNGFEDP